MEKRYAQALLAMVARGVTPHDAVAKVSVLLQTKGKVPLLPRIARAVRMIGERAERQQPVITITDRTQAPHVAKQNNVEQAQIIEDRTLIGGWRIFNGTKLKDASYKRHLKEIYSRVIA